LLATRLKLLANGVLVVALMVLLQACATTPEVAPPVAAEQPPIPAKKREPIPELDLNLPSSAGEACDCTSQNSVDRTYLDKGFTLLAAGDYREAVNYFRRYQRLESSPAVNWEASMAVAYVKMLPQSPYYNWRAARESYLRLMREQPAGVALDENIVLLRETLAILVDLHVQINDLQSENAALEENLEKREEALRRLRELMLGQKAVSP
jgi:tetratricopeptide (TPR) repeat protein